MLEAQRRRTTGRRAESPSPCPGRNLLSLIQFEARKLIPVLRKTLGPSGVQRLLQELIKEGLAAEAHSKSLKYELLKQMHETAGKGLPTFPGRTSAPVHLHPPVSYQWYCA